MEENIQSIKFNTSGIKISRFFSILLFIVYSSIIVLGLIYDPNLMFVLLPIFICLESLPLCIFISTFTKCWKYDEEKFLKRQFVLKKIIYYRDISYFKNETCWSPGIRGRKPYLYKKGFFTLTNGKKIEFDISCSSKEFMKMWRKIKKVNPKVQLIEFPN